MSTVKEQVRQIAEKLPENATWEQVRYELHVREQIEEGERAIAEGRTVPHDEVKKLFSPRMRIPWSRLAAGPAAEISSGPEAPPLALTARPNAWQLGSALRVVANLPDRAPNVHVGVPEGPIVRQAYTLCRFDLYRWAP